MIRLPSFFKRKTQSDDLELGSRGNRTVKRVAPRSLQRSIEAEELALTEDPEQQRARHRLIGAAVLVLIAVIGLPRILDSKPKSSPNDIAINIVTSLPMPGAESKPDAKTEVKSEAKPKTDAVVEAPKAVVPAPEVKADAKPEPKLESKPSAPTVSKSATLGLAAGEEVVASANTKPKVDDASKAVTPNNSATSNASASGTGKYVIQIGAFASEERAKGWVAKLKDQKIPYYTSTKTGADGVKLYLLRAGPYTDKDLADAAEKKIKAMGLSPKVIESGKQ
ncbi:SPOR domain-containing protein [Polynucleobacter sp. MWH-Braz-FAM2G]|uniref:SPOR domain-containing protein n=1 Tax=Polynucleobacter sp. MWH-Braz-FAM2G TaxID=1855883 RepID=UPI001BFD00AF|nr:SPOR domain-containing protein [Polynucleobacter sp. MWH-Braz-FAM2G]QWD91547.1 SPOR domain-containing protein [Polynucleobacter sp. MWH-Braz-FAM2G]